MSIFSRKWQASRIQNQFRIYRARRTPEGNILLIEFSQCDDCATWLIHRCSLFAFENLMLGLINLDRASFNWYFIILQHTKELNCVNWRLPLNINAVLKWSWLSAAQWFELTGRCHYIGAITPPFLVDIWFVLLFIIRYQIFISYLRTDWHDIWLFYTGQFCSLVPP